MRIFISWSGPRSEAVARALKSWIKCVLQATDPWISSSIPRGTAWREELRSQLAGTDNGILCITKANRESPWLLFEAGAIAKLENARTCTLLVDLKNSEVKEPLAMFQSTEMKQPIPLIRGQISTLAFSRRLRVCFPTLGGRCGGIGRRARLKI
jgi:hypothetical protein